MQLGLLHLPRPPFAKPASRPANKVHPKPAARVGLSSNCSVTPWETRVAVQFKFYQRTFSFNTATLFTSSVQVKLGLIPRTAVMTGMTFCGWLMEFVSSGPSVSLISSALELRLGRRRGGRIRTHQTHVKNTASQRVRVRDEADRHASVLRR